MGIITAKKTEAIFNKFEIIFKFIFLTLTMLSFNCVFAGHILLKVLALVVLVAGAVIVVYRLLTAKKYIKFFGFPILIAVVGAYIVSCILNYKYGILENIQGLAWMVFHFGILYVSDTTKSAEQNKKIYFALLKYFMAFITVSNIASIIMLLVKYGDNAANSFSGNIIGYIWGRLWGVYSDPNIGSVLNVAAIMVSCYCFGKAKRWFGKLLFALNILLSLCYISFSDSRTGMVCLVIVVLVSCYLWLKSTVSLKLNLIVKQLLCVVLSVVISVTAVASLYAIKGAYNEGVRLIHQLQTDDTPDDTPCTPSTPDNPSDTTPDVPKDDAIGRTGNELESDVSNGRFDLWISGIEIWKTAPIFGVSHRNIVPYTLENVPDTYLVNNEKSFNFDTTHNAYIDVLLAQGIVGAVLVLAFLALMVFVIFKNMVFTKSNKKCTAENILMLSIILTFACSAFFVLEVMYINTVGAFLFWLSLGILVTNLKQETQPET